MITAADIKRGFETGKVKLVTAPIGSDTVCQIGDYWFYFGGETAEYISPEEYMKSVPMEDIVSDIMGVLNEFKSMTGFVDEYNYYESILKEA